MKQVFSLPGRRWWAGLPPAADAAVMAAGILSAGLYLIGSEGARRRAAPLAPARRP
ncbi:hypothetical protein ABZZ20_26545 [Streptomyces sp. NPDC006430]|uniref:hypothetical protein n=1 Tax=Streptomyces sp. NPDC006430 TaxID=3154299 RepID=UPI0033B16AC2